MAKLLRFRYTIAMTKYDDIYEIAADNYGLITSSQAREIGVTNNELVQYARRGKLERLGQGVYRLTRHVPSPLDTYALAVALAGPNAYLSGESVIAMLELGPTNPAFVHVSTQDRTRRKSPAWLDVNRAAEDEPVTAYEGIPSQPVASAIRSCRGKMMEERLIQATNNARAQGYISRSQAQDLLEELS